MQGSNNVCKKPIGAVREPPLLHCFLNQDSQQDFQDGQDWAVLENNALPKNPANLINLMKIVVQKYARLGSTKNVGGRLVAP